MQITERTYRWARPLVARAGGPKGIVWHHSAAASSSAAEIHRWHIGRGWSGIGYHFVVRRSGMIERGRPENTIGSHTLGINERIGVCCEGNLENQTMTAAQGASVVWLNDHLMRKYKVTASRHSDHAPTACPGENFPWPIPRPLRTRPTLRLGSEGVHVTYLQRRLRAHKFMTVVDGDFGPHTDRMVRAFQKAKRLEVDGVVGRFTWAKLG